jgi:hypothetical protein
VGIELRLLSGSHPSEQQSDTAATFDEARAYSNAHGGCFYRSAPRPIFQALRLQRDWTARKYALWDAGKRLEPPSYGPGRPGACEFRKCSRGEVFDMHRGGLLKRPDVPDDAKDQQ